MSVAQTKRRPTPARTLGLGFVAAIGVHVAVVGTVEALRDPSVPVAIPPGADGTGTSANPAVPPEPIAELTSTCAGDAALAAAGRSTACLAPWARSIDACLADVKAALDDELTRCRTNPDPLAVQVVEMTREDIARIDPEPMLELLDAAQQLKFEQQQQQQIAQLEQQEQQRQAQMAKQQAQVVEVAKPDTEVEPDNAHFLSEYSTKVEKETVARGSRDEAMVAKSKPASLPTKDNARDPSSAKPPTDRPPGTNPDAPDAPGKLSMRHPGAIVPAHAAEDEKVRGRYDGWHTPIADGFTAKHGNAGIDQDARQADETQGAGGAERPERMEPRCCVVRRRAVRG